MLSHAILFLIFSALGVLCAALSSAPRHRFEEYLPVSCSGIVLILFGFGLVGALKTGVYFICALSMLLYMISFAAIIKNKSYLTFFRNLFSPGFFIFVLFYAGLTVLNDGRVVSLWDEFTHWADISKVMFTLDDFGTNPLSHSMFKSYVPGMSLFQYFFQKIHQMVDSYPDFSEWRLYFSYHIFAFSFFFPFLKKITFKRIVPGAFVLGTLCMVPMIFFGWDFPKGLYIDAFVGIVAGCGFAFLYVNRNKDGFTYISLFSIMMMLVLAKDVGVFFAAFLAAALVLDELLSSYKKWNNKRIFHLIIVSVCAFLSVWLPKYLRNLHLEERHVSKVFGQSIHFNVLLDVLKGTDTSYRSIVLENYIHAFFNNKQTISIFEIQMSWPAILVILSAGLIIIHWIGMKTEAANEKPRSSTVIIVLLQTIFYSAGLCVIYMFKFSKTEATGLASFDRYLGMAYLALLLMLLLSAFDYVKRHPVRSSDLGMLTLSFSLILLPMDYVQAFLNRNSVGTSSAIRQPYDYVAEHILYLTQNESKKVYILSQRDYGLDYYALRYSIRPCISNSNAFSISPDSERSRNNRYTKIKTADEWKTELQDYDYVILYQLDEDFVHDYGVLFEKIEDIQPFSIFKVNHHTGLLSRCW